MAKSNFNKKFKKECKELGGKPEEGVCTFKGLKVKRAVKVLDELQKEFEDTEFYLKGRGDGTVELGSVKKKLEEKS